MPDRPVHVAEISQEVSESFAAFVREHSGSLYGTAYLISGDVDVAEDLVQETLVGLLPKWSLVQASRSPLAYVRRSLVNRFVDSRRGPRGRVTSVAEPPEAPSVGDLADGVASDDALRRLLVGLPESQRSAVVLRFLYDWDDAAIAAAIGCRRSSVRSMTRRGLLALRAAARAQQADVISVQARPPDTKTEREQ